MPGLNRRAREKVDTGDASRGGVPTPLVAIALVLMLPIRLAGAQSAIGQSPAAGKVDFNREIRSILAKNCFPCHGQDEAKRAKGLRLDRRDSAINPLKNG